jgi:hypothetical protein
LKNKTTFSITVYPTLNTISLEYHCYNLPLDAHGMLLKRKRKNFDVSLCVLTFRIDGRRAGGPKTTYCPMNLQL